MKKSILHTALLLLPALPLSAQFYLVDFAKLYTLNGSWITERKNGTLYEIWRIENDSVMYGHSFRVFNKDTIKLETVALSFNKGIIAYTPTTQNQNQQQPVVFTLMNIAGSVFSFENKAHDFPQVIRYDVSKKDSLYASISGNTNQGLKTIQFPYKKYNPE